MQKPKPAGKFGISGNLSEAEYMAMSQRARELGLSVSQVLRDAVALWVDQIDRADKEVNQL